MAVLNSTSIDSKGYNAINYDHLGVYGDEGIIHLPYVGKGKMLIELLVWKGGGGGYPNIYTPNYGGRYAVWVSGGSEKIQAYSGYGYPLMFMGFYEDNEFIFRMQSNDTWVIMMNMYDYY